MEDILSLVDILSEDNDCGGQTGNPIAALQRLL